MRGTIVSVVALAAICTIGTAKAKTVYRHMIKNAAPVWTPATTAANARVGVPSEVSVGAASDADGDSLVYTCSSGNGTASIGAYGTLTVVPAKAGTYKVACSASDGLGGVAQIAIEVTASER
jgi:hypothetical protein